MRVYDVIQMRSLKAESFASDGKWRSSVTYKAPKGQAFVLILVGAADLDKLEAFSADDALRDAGWTLDAPVESAMAASTPSGEEKP